MLLGFWNKSVYITYLGVFCAVFGLFFSIEYGNPDYAFAGMMIAAVCDMFDGKVARSIPNRTEQEKNFGVEIDSLGDIVCFITVPAIAIYEMVKLNGNIHMFHYVALSLYVVCGVIRLAYFNVAMADNSKAIHEYQGLPVPVGVFIFALIWIIGKIFNLGVGIAWAYTIAAPLVGLLHVLKPVRIRKYTGTWFYVTVCIVAAILISLIFIL